MPVYSSSDSSSSFVVISNSIVSVITLETTVRGKGLLQSEQLAQVCKQERDFECCMVANLGDSQKYGDDDVLFVPVVVAVKSDGIISTSTFNNSVFTLGPGETLFTSS